MLSILRLSTTTRPVRCGKRWTSTGASALDNPAYGWTGHGGEEAVGTDVGTEVALVALCPWRTQAVLMKAAGTAVVSATATPRCWQRRLTAREARGHPNSTTCH